MKTSADIPILCLCIWICLVVGCSDNTRQNAGKKYGPEELESRQVRLEEMLGRLEQSQSETAKDLRKSYEAHKQAQIELEKALPELTKNPDHYRLQCEYTDALIQMLEMSFPQPTE